MLSIAEFLKLFLLITQLFIIEQSHAVGPSLSRIFNRQSSSSLSSLSSGRLSSDTATVDTLPLSEIPECSLPMLAWNFTLYCSQHLTRIEQEELKDVETVYYCSSVNYGSRSRAAEEDSKAVSDFPRLSIGDHVDFKYKIGSVVADGTEGLVVRAYDMSQQGKVVALKFNRKERDAQYENDILKRVALSMDSRDSDKHVVEPIEHIIYRGWDVWVYPYIPVDWIDITSENSAIPLSYLQKLTKCMVDALLFLKSINVIHMDLKPDNILYNIDTDESYLTDFGLAMFKEDAETFRGLRGTYEYIAPEFYLRHRGITHAADIWSLGATLFVLATGGEFIDFSGVPDSAKRFRAIRLMHGRVPPESNHFYDSISFPLAYYDSGHGRKTKTVFEDLDFAMASKYGLDDRELFAEMKDFIEKCLKWNPENRITVKAAAQHPFLTRLNV